MLRGAVTKIVDHPTQHFCIWISTKFGLKRGTPNQDKLRPEMGHHKSGQIKFGVFENHLFRYLFNVKHIKIDKTINISIYKLLKPLAKVKSRKYLIHKTC